MWKIISFTLAFSFIITAEAKFSAADCRELGFTKSQLMCSNCEKLSDFGLEILNDHCRECCTEDLLPAAERRYPKAILEVCTCKFRAYPQIEAFIKSGRPAKFSNLHIKYVRGLDPVVKLLDASGQVQETLSITKWNTDTVEEFFETHLEKTGGSGKSGQKKADTDSSTTTGGKSSYSVMDETFDDLDEFLRTNLV